MKLNRNIIWIIPLFFIITYPLWSIPVGNFLTPRGGFDPDIKRPPPKNAQNLPLIKSKLLRIKTVKRLHLLSLTRPEQAMFLTSCSWITWMQISLMKREI